MNNEKILQIKNLFISTKKGKKLVDNVSFDLKKGSTVGIVGASGSGKSLTCKAVLKLLSEDKFNITGNILFNNENLLKVKDKRMEKIRGKKIGVIFQDPMTAFDPCFKIGNQMVETLKVHYKISKREAITKSEAGLEKLNLGSIKRIMNSYPHMLSGGMLQRIMISLTLMIEPEIIIADEPTTALDTKTQSIIISEFKEIKRQNESLTMLFVSHDLEVISELAHEIVVFNNGKVVETGELSNVLRNPINIYTKSLIDQHLKFNEVKK